MTVVLGGDITIEFEKGNCPQVEDEEVTRLAPTLSLHFPRPRNAQSPP